MRRKRWIMLALLPALLLAGDFVYWRLAVGQLRSAFDSWTARTQATGWVVRHGAVISGGWPDAATLRVENFTISTPAAPGRPAVVLGGQYRGGVDWGSDAILLRTRLTLPDVLDVTSAGPRPLRLSDGRTIPVTADYLRLRLTLRASGPPRDIDIEAAALAASIPGFGLVKIGQLTSQAELHPDAGRDQPAVTFSLSAAPVILPDGAHLGLGPEIQEVALEGVLNGPLPARGLSPTERAMSWRDEGGSLELHRVAIGWGQARLDATATLALDEDLQPMGAGNGKIAGYGAALDALAANAVVTRSAAQAAKAVLSLLADTPADGQPEEVEVPLTLQFRTLSVHQVPLVRLPELDWPGH